MALAHSHMQCYNSRQLHKKKAALPGAGNTKQSLTQTAEDTAAGLGVDSTTAWSNCTLSGVSAGGVLFSGQRGGLVATVKQYAVWAEQRIAAIVQREGLACGLISVVQGPLVLTYTVRLLAPSPASLRRILGLGPALAQVLQVESVRVSDTAGGVQIEIPSPVLHTPRASELLRHTHGLHVAVGLNSQRQPVCVDLSQHGAILWVGPSRRGKTESLKSAVYGLMRANHWQRVQCLVMSQKRADWLSLAGAAGCIGLLSDPAECSQALRWVASNVLQGRASDGKGIIAPALLIVVDDLLNLLERAPEIAGPLAEIASMGAGLAVHLLAGTQEAGSKRGTGGPAVEANVTCRIVYRSSSAVGAARAAGMGGAGVEQLTSAKGDALLIEHGEVVRIATGWADDREILQLEQGQLSGAPWRTLQPVTTGHNRLQPPQPPVVPPITTGHVPTSGRGGSVAVVPVAAVVDEIFPIDKRAATPKEKAVIQALYRAGESLSALCRRVYGHKDGKALAFVKEAIGSGSAAAESESERSNELDLNTAEGLAALEALKASGALRWRDASEILQ